MSAGPTLVIQERDGCAVLRVRVTPGAKKTGLSIRNDGVLQVRVCAPPVEGKANDALIRCLARDILGVSQSVVRIQRGGRAREKTLVIGATADWVRERIECAIIGVGR
ncbi:MAG: DUF167 domain-containing protein [Myxococcota bacterium]|nr:DUF167 domain-containing protein [Myxococcota bacterium]